MHSDIDAASVAWFHERQLRQRDWPVVSRTASPSFPDARAAAWAGIDANHRYNGLAWHEDERTRRLDLPPSEIAAGKRLAERYDQKRKDAVGAIDAALLALFAGVVRQPHARLSSETPGAMIDRLSTLSLWIHAMRLHAQRREGGEEYVRACSARLERLQAQRRDLMGCLDALLADARHGRACFTLCRRYPTADDPALAVGRDEVREQATS